MTSTSCPHYVFFARVRPNIDSLFVQHCHKMCITPQSLVVSFYLRTHVIGATQHENDFTEFCLLYFFFFKTHLINLKVINNHITEHSLLRQKKQRNTNYTLYSTVTGLTRNCHTKKLDPPHTDIKAQLEKPQHQVFIKRVKLTTIHFLFFVSSFHCIMETF